jgi:hypothetical protein
MFKKTCFDKHHSIFSKLDQWAKDTHLIRRISAKFSASSFLHSLLKNIPSGKGSGNQLAISLAESGLVAMSRQALHKRLNVYAVSFLLKVIHGLLVGFVEESSSSLSIFKKRGIKRILIEDSTTLRLPKSNAENFPAHGNSKGETAGVKCDLIYDILSSQPLAYTLYSATEQDRTIGKDALALAQKDDLILRDMGYFDLSEFAYLERIEAYWLTRLTLSANLTNEEGIKLETLLQNAKGKSLDIPVIVGKQKHRCRLIAIRADKRIAEERRRKRKAEGRKDGKTPTAAALIRDGWHLMLTNLTPQQATTTDIAKIYRIRWAIEIQFRAWKQSTQITSALNRKTQASHIECLVLASLIIHLMGLRLINIFQEKMNLENLSIEKLYDLLAEKILNAKSWQDMDFENIDLRHIQRDRRTRKSPILQGLEALS